MAADAFGPLMQRHDWTAVELAERSGPSVVPTLRPYLKSDDELVRLLAIDCIAAAGGPDAPDLLLDALADPYEQNRFHAANALHRNLPDGRVRRVLAIYDSTRDEYVKQQLAMVLGRMDDRSIPRELNTRFTRITRQTSPEPYDGLTAAVARLGDDPARDRLGAMLRDEHGERIKALIDLCQYVDQPWLVHRLVPVLDKREIAVDLSSHRKTVLRRSCDLAVDEIARLSGHTFSFPISPTEQYDEAKLREVKQFASSWSPP